MLEVLRSPVGVASARNAPFSIDIWRSCGALPDVVPTLSALRAQSNRFFVVRGRQFQALGMSSTCRRRLMLRS